jgi:phytoene desaturase
LCLITNKFILSKKAIIIGAGLGSLATALRLTTHGYKVEIIEKHHQAGGRLNQLKKDGFTFDVGPSFFSMSYEFTELFDYCKIQNPLEMNELNPVYSVYFAGKEKPYSIYKELDKLAQEFADIEPNFKEKAERYLKSAGEIFHDTEHVIIKRNYDNLFQYAVALMTVPLKHSPKLVRTMWTELERYFDSEHVKVIFSLVAFFLGSTPFDTPAVYSLLNYTELKHDGYWNIKGGMYKIVEEIQKILINRDVRFHFNTEITKVNYNNTKVQTVIDSTGKEWNADIFICNGDAAAFRGKVLKRKKYSEEKLDKKHWTLAPFTIYLGIKGKLDNLHHHNYFLGSNFKQYADNIFKLSVNPEKPYYYVNASSKSNADCAPEGCENLFILCPVPDRRFKNDWSDREELADTILKDMSERIGYDLIANRITQTIYAPDDWESMFNLYRGSGLGLAHGLNQVAAMRPNNKDEEFNNLYYVGASTVPGTGYLL